MNNRFPIFPTEIHGYRRRGYGSEAGYPSRLPAPGFVLPEPGSTFTELSGGAWGSYWERLDEADLERAQADMKEIEATFRAAKLRKADLLAEFGSFMTGGLRKEDLLQRAIHRQWERWWPVHRVK